MPRETPHPDAAIDERHASISYGSRHPASLSTAIARIEAMLALGTPITQSTIQRQYPQTMPRWLIEDALLLLMARGSVIVEVPEWVFHRAMRAPSPVPVMASVAELGTAHEPCNSPVTIPPYSCHKAGL